MKGTSRSAHLDLPGDLGGAEEGEGDSRPASLERSEPVEEDNGDGGYS